MARDPLETLPSVPQFNVEATDVNPDQTFSLPQYSGRMGIQGGKDESPAIRFSNVPEETKSLVVQIYDPDAPTAGGYWHWTVINLPKDAEELGADTGNPDQNKLPGKAKNMLNDAGFAGYIGAAPPQGEKHRYFVIVSALNIDDLNLDENTTPNTINFQFNSHIISRAVTIIEGSN